jgi:1-acylglycerone phosphate reductase
MAMITSFIDLLVPAQGLIINVASISALVPYVFGAVYASSKAAVASYSRTLHAELRPFGVSVQVFMAGTVKSNMGNAPKGGLPKNSLYQRVRHLYEARLGVSQKESKPVSTDRLRASWWMMR